MAEPLWRVKLEDDVTVSVWPDQAGRTFRLRVEYPNPEFIDPAAPYIAEKVVTRERVRQLWLAVCRGTAKNAGPTR